MSDSKSVGRALLLDAFRDDVFKLRMAKEDDRDFAAAVVDAVLVAQGVRRACLFGLGLAPRNAQLVERLERELGLECVRLTDPAEEPVLKFETFFAFRKGDARTRRIALVHRACFGASDDDLEKAKKRCDAAGGAEIGWGKAGEAFGYLHPSTGSTKSNGAIDFFVLGLARRSTISIMGSQSADIEASEVGSYVSKRCRAASRVLKSLVGDAFPDVSVAAALYVR